MKPLTVSLIGAGRVGATLALMLHRRGHRIVCIINRSPEAALRTARLVDCGLSSTENAALAPETDLLAIAVPDEQLEAVAAEVAERAKLNFHDLVAFHTSGVHTSDLLDPLAKKGAVTCSIHPIQTFAAGMPVEEQVGMMKGISYGIEGNDQGRRMAEQIVAALEGNILVVPKEEKISYHLACVFASNYTVALLGAVEELTASYGGSSALKHFRTLVESSIANAVRMSPAKALTGPIARGSSRVIEAHVSGLQTRPDLQELYKSLASWAIELAQRGKRITPEQAQRLKETLSR
ncbi:MAG: DUF2520 domain-containing protein [Ignavibacteriales bacterium]|nr:DUF2520 domain-containing protein [Ignavibacteriales bacterium]